MKVLVNTDLERESVSLIEKNRGKDLDVCNTRTLTLGLGNKIFAGPIGRAA